MTAWRAIRWSSAWLFIPLLLVCAYVGATSEQEFFGDYRLVGVTQAWVCLVVVAPGFAGWAAWDASRIRPWLDGPVGGARRPKATAGLIAPAVLIASALVLATVMLVTGLPQDLVGWAVTGCGWLTIIAAACFGIGLGFIAPRVIATPAAVLICYAAMAIGVSNPYRWQARLSLTGIAAPCCSETEQISWSAVGTVCLTLLCVIVCCLAVLAPSKGRPARGLAMTVGIALSVAIGWSTTAAARPLAQLQPRTTATNCHTQAGTRICLWPEHAEQTSAVATNIRHAQTAGESLGLSLPATWSEKPTSQAVTFMWSSNASPTEHTYALAVDLAHWLGCTSPTSEEAATSYLGLRMGLSVQDLTSRGIRKTGLARYLKGSPAAQNSAARALFTKCRA